METIYSLILWEKMKRTPAQCKIHQMKHEEIERDFKQYLEEVGAEQFKKDIRENSFLDTKLNELYYDGQFYEFNDSHHKTQVSIDPENADRYLVKHIYHETMVESTILSLMMEHLHPDASEFLTKIHKAWHSKKNENQKKESQTS